MSENGDKPQDGFAKVDPSLIFMSRENQEVFNTSQMF